MSNRRANVDNNMIGRYLMCASFLILVCCLPAMGQNQATKLDEFPDLKADDAQAHLDIFAKRLLDEPHASGKIVAFYPDTWPPGFFLRHIHGHADYLVNKRGIPADRVAVTVGGPKSRFLIELWLVPKGSPLPNASTTGLFTFTQLTEFDSLFFGPDCESQYPLTLEDPSDAVRFFAVALQQNPTMKGLVIVHPKGSRSDRESRSLFAPTTSKLVKEHSISPDRLITNFADVRDCGDLQLWFVPSDFVVPKGQTAPTYLQSRLMAEAENRYSIRFVYFYGNKYTRDSLLRNAMPGLLEGEVFTTAVLRKSLADVSRLSVIKPIRIRDVEVNLNRSASTIDLSLFFRERPRRRR